MKKTRWTLKCGRKPGMRRAYAWVFAVSLLVMSLCPDQAMAADVIGGSDSTPNKTEYELCTNEKDDSYVGTEGENQDEKADLAEPEDSPVTVETPQPEPEDSPGIVETPQPEPEDSPGIVETPQPEPKDSPGIVETPQPEPEESHEPTQTPQIPEAIESPQPEESPVPTQTPEPEQTPEVARSPQPRDRLLQAYLRLPQALRI